MALVYNLFVVLQYDLHAKTPPSHHQCMQSLYRAPIVPFFFALIFILILIYDGKIDPGLVSFELDLGV